MTKKVFLVGSSKELIPQLDPTKISYFSSMVEDWIPEYHTEEIEPRKECDFVLYIITKQTLDFYSIAEVVDESNKRPHKTIFCYLEEGFGKHQVKSLKATAKMVEENGAKVFTNLAEVANYLNSEQKMVARVEAEFLPNH